MIFRPDLAQAVMDGRKTVTRRLVREDKPRSPWHPDRAPKLVGKRVAVCPGRGKRAIGTVRVVSVKREPEFVPLNISDEEAIREGFAGTYWRPNFWRPPWLRFCDAWHDLHGCEALLATCDVWRIEFTDPAPAGEGRRGWYELPPEGETEICPVCRARAERHRRKENPVRKRQEENQ